MHVGSLWGAGTATPGNYIDPVCYVQLQQQLPPLMLQPRQQLLPVRPPALLQLLAVLLDRPRPQDDCCHINTVFCGLGHAKHTF